MTARTSEIVLPGNPPVRRGARSGLVRAPDRRSKSCRRVLLLAVDPLDFGSQIVQHSTGLNPETIFSSSGSKSADWGIYGHNNCGMSGRPSQAAQVQAAPFRVQANRPGAYPHQLQGGKRPSLRRPSPTGERDFCGASHEIIRLEGCARGCAAGFGAGGYAGPISRIGLGVIGCGAEAGAFPQGYERQLREGYLSNAVAQRAVAWWPMRSRGCR